MIEGYIPKNERKKILLLCDDIRMHSGIATMAREFVVNLSHKDNWFQLGAALKHPDQGKTFDISQDVGKKIGINDADVKVMPWNGYGDAGVIRNLGVKEDLVMINYLGVDDDSINESEPLNRAFDAVFIGRLHESKGIFDIVPIWQKIVDKLPNATLGVVGMAEQTIKKAFESQIRNAKLEKNIIILGYHIGKDAYAYLKSSKVFFFPSHEEGFGIVIAEAMTAGSAVVTYDLEVYKETFSSSIYTAKCFDCSDFADKVICLLEDENLRLDIVSGAKELAKNFTWKNCAKREYREINKTFLKKIKFSA